MGVVAFDPAAFKLAYPQFSSIADELLQSYFSLATLYLNNTDCSPITDLNQRETLLNLIVAHIAQLSVGANGAGGSGVAGRVSKATEGTVSVEFDVGPQTNSSAFWAQTPFGLMYWQATAPYRSFRYYPRRNRCGC